MIVASVKRLETSAGVRNLTKRHTRGTKLPGRIVRRHRDRVNRVASAYCLQQAEKCREEAARARDDDIRAYWKEAERCWRAVAQQVEARTWPFVSKEPEKSD